MTQFRNLLVSSHLNKFSSSTLKATLHVAINATDHKYAFLWFKINLDDLKQLIIAKKIIKENCSRIRVPMPLWWGFSRVQRNILRS